MGIPPLKEFLDNKIEEKITISDEARAAWKAALPQSRLPSGGAVFDIFIEDVPTRLRHLGSGIDIHTLFERLSKPHRVDNKAKIFVLINDNYDYDVPTKRKTHEERKSRPIRPDSLPYPAEAVQWTDEYPWIQGINPQDVSALRLANTPHLCKTILHQYGKWLKATRTTIEWPKDMYLVLDERDQPVVFTSEADQPAPWRLDESQFPLWPVREGDVKAILWARYLVSKRPGEVISSVCIQTSDSDTLALGIYHWWNGNGGSRLYWQPIIDFNQKPLHWPIHWLIEYLAKPQTFNNRDAFLVFMVTMGSDHFKTRKQILHGCRHETAWEMLHVKNWTLKQWITWVKGVPPPPGNPSDPDNWQTELMAALHYWETLGMDYDRNEVVPCSPLGARRLLLPQIEAKSDIESEATMVEQEEEEEVSQRLGPSFVLLMPEQQREEEQDMSPRLNHPTDLHAQRRARIREEQQQQQEDEERRDYVFVDVDPRTLTLPPLEPLTQPEMMDVTAIP